MLSLLKFGWKCLLKTQSLSLNDGRCGQWCEMHGQRIWRSQCRRSCFLRKILEISWLYVTIVSFMGSKTKAFLLENKLHLERLSAIGVFLEAPLGEAAWRTAFPGCTNVFFSPEIYCTYFPYNIFIDWIGNNCSNILGPVGFSKADYLFSNLLLKLKTWQVVPLTVPSSLFLCATTVHVYLK